MEKLKRLIGIFLFAVMFINLIEVTSDKQKVYADTFGIYTYWAAYGNAVILHCDDSASGVLDIPSTLGGYPVIIIDNQAFKDLTNITAVNIPNTVYFIHDSAFMNCSSLTSVSIAESVSSVASFAFYNCSSLPTINIPKSVLYIGHDAFSFCNNLKSINVDAENQSYSSADGVLFNKTKTTLVSFPGGTAGEYTIPDGITEIADSAFAGCANLTSVSIPRSVTKIGTGAFLGCSGITIYGEPGSYAETYANENGIRFIDISKINGNSNSTSTGAPIISTASISYSGAEYNLFFKTLNIEKDSNIEVSVKVDVNNNSCGNVKVYLTQGIKNAVQLTSNTYTTVQPGNIFSESGTIYVLAVDEATGKSATKETKLRITQFADGDLLPASGADNLNFKLGKRVSFTIPDSVVCPFGGMDIGFDLDFIPVTFEYEANNKIKIAFGLSSDNIDETTGRFKGFSYENYMAEIKECAAKSSNEYEAAKSNTELFEKIKQKFPNIKFKKVNFNVSNDINSSIDVCGYAQMNLVNGNWIFSEGYLALNAEIKFEREGQIFLMSIPCYYEIGGGVGAGIDGKMTNIDPNGLVPTFEGYLSEKIMANIGGGVGISRICTFGASGEGSLNIKKGINTDYLKSWGEGSANLNMKILGRTVAERVFAKGSFLIYETGSNAGLIKDDAVSLLSVANSDIYSQVNIDKIYQNEDRSYAGRETKWLGNSKQKSVSLMGSEYTNKNLNRMAENVYTEARPMISDCSGTKVMVMQWDESVRNDADRAMLVYSVYNENTKAWSSPQAVYDDGTADFYPSFNDGYLTWQNQKTAVSDNSTLKDIAQQAEICVAKWNGNGFDTPVTLTDNTSLDTQPFVASNGTNTTVVWTKNSNDDILGISGSNSIMKSTFDRQQWSSAVEIKGNANAIVNLTAGYFEGNCYVAYVPDNDNNLNTISDRDIYMMNNTNEYKLTDNNVLDDNPIIKNNLIYYYSDGNIKYSTLDGENRNMVFDESKEDLSDSFVVGVNGSGDTAIWWTKNDDNSMEVYMSLEQNGVWNDEVKVTDLGNQAKYPSGILNDDGTMMVAFDNYIWVDNMLTQTDIYTVSVNPSYDIEIIDAFVDEKTMTFYATVKNSGEVNINGYTVELYDNGINSTQTITDPLKAGQSRDIQLYYNMPGNMTGRTVEIRANIEDGEEYNTENNSSQISIGNADIEVSDVSVTKGDIYKISSNIWNTGFTDAQDVSVQLHADSENGAVLGEKSIGLAAGGNDTVEFDVDYNLLKFDSGAKQLYVTAMCNETEAFIGNNSKYIYINSPSGDADYKSNILNYNMVDGKFVVNAVVRNNKGEDRTCAAFFAIYDAEGRLVNVVEQDVTVNSYQDTGVDAWFNGYDEQNGDTIKMFVWDSDSTMSPVCPMSKVVIE